MGRFVDRWLVAATILLASLPAQAEPAALHIVNSGDETMDCRIVEGTTSAELRTGKTVVRAILKPGEAKDFTAPAGRYTLFPWKYMDQGTRSLAFYPFRLKEGQALTITVSRGATPVFSGTAHRINVESRPTGR